MKKLFFVIITVTALAACNDDGNIVVKDLSFDVQSSFDNDHLRITVDGKDVLDEDVTTLEVLGVDTDASRSVSVVAGAHRIKIVVNHDKEFTTIISIHHDLYIGVQYNRQTEEISIIESDRPFLYD